MSVNVEFEDNSDFIMKELDEKEEKVLYAWGLKIQSLATRYITANKSVDTGRLRASITFITPENFGEALYKGKGSDIKPSDKLSGRSEERTLTIGSNVEYANFVELGTSKSNAKPFLKPAIENAKTTMRNIFRRVMEE